MSKGLKADDNLQRRILLHSPSHAFAEDYDMTINLEASKCSQYLKALGDPTRLQIVEYLQDGARSVSEIAEYLSTEISNASHHLHVLAHASLLISEKAGKFCYYSLPPEILHVGEGKRLSWLEFGCCRLELGRTRKEHR